VDNGKAMVTLAGPSRGELAFKNAEGEQIGEATHIEGGSTVEIDIPEGTQAYDVTFGGGGNSSTGYDSSTSALPSAEAASSVVGAPALRQIPPEYSLMCLTADFDPTETSYAYLLHALSDDSAEAFAQMGAILDEGVGASVQPGVSVDAFVEVTIAGNNVKLVSSLVHEFTSYTATINGFVVAELGSGFNAAVSHGPNGWISVTSYMPLDLIQPNQTLYLHQQAMGAPEPVYMAIQG